MDLTACWSLICDVDVCSLAHWLGTGEKPWHQTNCDTKPQRIFEDTGLLIPLVQEVAAKILSQFPMPCVIHDAIASRMKAHQSHPFHVDIQRSDWVTRVHVPITTNAHCWMMFEKEMAHVHFEAGKAYTFNALERHAFGNDGETERVHLIFDVLRKDS